MSHQLASKKSRFEIPPLNWKAPETKQDTDAKTAAAKADAHQDREASRSTA
ncbi:hypothetical protein [Achromobacter sp. HZ01]|jgi:hypothetical protein|uniref:hypothetical protein n=1 Tax=Achromobacter sp. HZ01 TaxID=1416886 RepID=UPI00143D02BC|nr:hypothetical protein [Achromobacter sp. HZ01]